MFEEYKVDILKEFDLKEKLTLRLQADKKVMATEVEMAKMVICEKELCEVAQKNYKETIDVINKEKFLK